MIVLTLARFQRGMAAFGHRAVEREGCEGAASTKRRGAGRSGAARGLLAVWTAAATAALAASGYGREDPAPRIHLASMGYGATVQEQALMPVMVQVRNPGPRRTAEVLLSAPAGYSGQVLQVRRRLDLPARSHRQIEVPFVLDGSLGASGSAIGSLVNVALGDGGRVRWDRFEIIGRVYPPGTRTVAVSDARGAGYGWTGRTPGEDARDADNRFVVPPAQLPRNPGKLAFADVLILGSLGDHRLDAGQSASLVDWVAAGGLLILSPAAGLRADDLAELAPLLPGAWLGGAYVHTLVAPDGASFVSASNQPFWTAPLFPRPGAEVVGPADAPFALSRRHGRGVLMLLGFDAGSEAFQTWPGAPEFWRAWVPADAGTTGQRGEPFDLAPERVQELMRRMAGAEAASRGLVGAYLVIVLVVFGLLLFGTFAAGHAEWGWMGAMVFSLAAGGMLLWLVRRDAPEVASAVEVVYARAAPGGAGAQTEGGLGFYSPQERSVRAALDGEHGYVRPGRTGIRPPPVFPTEWHSGRLALDGLRVRAGEMRHAVGAHYLADARAPAGVLDCGAQGLRLRLPAAHGGVPLRGAYFRWRRMAVPIGTLPDDGWTSPWWRPDSRAAGFRFSTREILSERDEMQAALRSMVFPSAPVETGAVMPRLSDPRTHRHLDLDMPALYGFSDHPVWPLQVEHPVAERRGLVFWRIPVKVEAAGERLVWPRGVLPRRVAAHERTITEHPDGPVSGFGEARVQFEFSLPPESPPMELDAMRIFFRARGEGYRFTAMAPGLTQGGEGFEPSDPVLFPGAGRRADDTSRFRVEVRIVREGTLGERMQRWVIDDLDIELEGRGIPRIPPEEQS